MRLKALSRPVEACPDVLPALGAMDSESRQVRQVRSLVVFAQQIFQISSGDLFDLAVIDMGASMLKHESFVNLD